MSCNYAEGLSNYEYKGVLGLPEKFEIEDKVDEKCDVLADWLSKAKHVVVHTGAGISTSAGIPDFRGPNGVWTLEKMGKKPNINISFNDAKPTKTHMALKHLLEKRYIHFIVSQNIDGLHLKSGVPRDYMSELHGNMFTAECNICETQFVRQEATSTVGKKCLNEDCKRSATLRARSCRGKLHDTILDWEDSLPELDLEISEYNSSIADLNICLGTTLQINPSGNLPFRCKKFGGKVVIVNLQPTKHDKKANLIINSYVDTVLEKVMKRLGLEIPEYDPILDPTKKLASETVLEWNILNKDVKEMKQRYEKLLKDYKKRKADEKGNNGIVKVAKVEKWENEQKKDISKLKAEIIEQSNADNVDLTLSKDTDDDIFIE